MKNLCIFPLLLLALNVFGQELEGSWKLTYLNGEKVTDEEKVKIFQDGYFAFGAKTADTTNHFIGAGGGLKKNL